MPISDSRSLPAAASDVDALERCRARLIAAAMDAWEQAGASGLCHDGRWECALAALRRTPLSAASERD